MTGHPAPAPARDGSRYGPAGTGAPTDRPCPVCRSAGVPPRARYCSVACKQRAYRLRRGAATPAAVATWAADLPPGRAPVARIVYECPACEARLLGERRCPDCHVFCRRLGLGGLCPQCDEPVTLAELLGGEVLPTP